MRDYDEANTQGAPTPMMAQAGQGLAQPNLLARLHQRRRELESEIQKVCNSIAFVTNNQALVEVVEVVLASRDKCEPRPLGF